MCPYCRAPLLAAILITIDIPIAGVHREAMRSWISVLLVFATACSEPTTPSSDQDTEALWGSHDPSTQSVPDADARRAGTVYPETKPPEPIETPGKYA